MGAMSLMVAQSSLSDATVFEMRWFLISKSVGSSQNQMLAASSFTGIWGRGWVRLRCGGVGQRGVGMGWG